MDNIHHHDQELDEYYSYNKGAIFAGFGAFTMSAWAKKKKRMLLDAVKEDTIAAGKIAKQAVLFPGLF